MTRSPGGRALAAAIEPIVGSVYFSREAHDAFHALGHGPTTGQVTDEWSKAHWGAVLMTDYHAYFCGRGSILGQVPGEVIASAFGVFKPEVVTQAAVEGWRIADAAAMREARDRGAVAQLTRILGDPPEALDRVNELLEEAGSRLRVEGRPMYAAVLAQGLPDEAVLRMWRLAERLREFRGDAFVQAFVHHGFDGCEIQVLTERLAGFPPKTYSATRGWSDEDLDAAAARLAERGLLTADGRPTDAGLAAREAVEETVDGYCRPIEEALGEDLPELVGALQKWGDTLRANDGYYPSSPQEQVLHPDVQEWMRQHGFHPFRPDAGRRGTGRTPMSTETSVGPGRPPVVVVETEAAAPPGNVSFAQPPAEADKARRLYASFEPIAASVYFAPEVHRAFQAAGFGPPAEAEGCLPLADLPAYYCSRAGCMGQVPGDVVVAAFGVFAPEPMIAHVERGWRTADRDTVLRIRLEGQTAALHNVLGDRPGVDRATEILLRAGRAASPGGRFLYAGLLSLPLPPPGWGRLWRAADIIREYRGDSHIAAWLATGLDPVEAGLLTEIFYGMPSRYYHSGRGWRPSELDAGFDRLRRRGWIQGGIDDGDPVSFTDQGRAVRDWIEASTNAQQQPILDAIGDDYEELLGHLEPWAGAIVQAGYYPTDIRQLPPQWGQVPD